ncbi:hypothetical protein BJ165DRAFT_1409693 [Panaeolus papilionaceus]|nr:hypothetical protein BJ165DRAFT_1409693 [Panaeolus papilionaceus]
MRKTWAESIRRAAVVLIVAMSSGSSSSGNVDDGYPPWNFLQFSSPPSCLSYLGVASIPPLFATVVQAYSGVLSPQTMATTLAHSRYTSLTPNLRSCTQSSVLGIRITTHQHDKKWSSQTPSPLTTKTGLPHVADGPGSVVVEGWRIVGLGSGSRSDRVGSGNYYGVMITLRTITVGGASGKMVGMWMDTFGVLERREASMAKLDHEGSFGRAVIMGCRHYDSFVRDVSASNIFLRLLGVRD